MKKIMCILLVLLLSLTTVSAYSGGGGFIIPQKKDVEELTIKHINLSNSKFLVTGISQDFPVIILYFQNNQPDKTFMDVIEVPVETYDGVFDYEVIKAYHFYHNIKEGNLKEAKLNINLDKNINYFKVLKIDNNGNVEELEYKFKKDLKSQNGYEITTHGFSDILIVKEKLRTKENFKENWFKNNLNSLEKFDRVSRLLLDFCLIVLVLDLSLIDIVIYSYKRRKIK